MRGIAAVGILLSSTAVSSACFATLSKGELKALVQARCLLLSAHRFDVALTDLSGASRWPIFTSTTYASDGLRYYFRRDTTAANSVDAATGLFVGLQEAWVVDDGFVWRDAASKHADVWPKNALDVHAGLTTKMPLIACDLFAAFLPAFPNSMQALRLDVLLDDPLTFVTQVDAACYRVVGPASAIDPELVWDVTLDAAELAMPISVRLPGSSLELRVEDTSLFGGVLMPVRARLAPLEYWSAVSAGLLCNPEDFSPVIDVSVTSSSVGWNGWVGADAPALPTSWSEVVDGLPAGTAVMNAINNQVTLVASNSPAQRALASVAGLDRRHQRVSGSGGAPAESGIATVLGVMSLVGASFFAGRRARDAIRNRSK
ncbi:MAG: hypothetical protein U0572_04925 [Phycisphaerales bacterium]